MSTPTPEAQVAQELAAIAARIAALASGPPNTHLIGAELVEIKAHLRRLAEDNAEVRARLGSALGLQPVQDPPVG